jgi:hypothetical protein
MSELWNELCVGPFTLIFRCFFQPTRFRKECEIPGWRKRVLPMLKLLPSMLITSLALTVVIALLIHLLLRGQKLYSTDAPLLIQQADYLTKFGLMLLVTLSITALLGIICGLTLGVPLGMGAGLAVDLLFCFAGGLAGHPFEDAPLETVAGMPVDALIFVGFGCCLGIGFALAFANREVAPVSVRTGMFLILGFCCIMGVAFVLIYGSFHRDYYSYNYNYYYYSYYYRYNYNYNYYYSYNYNYYNAKYLYMYIHVGWITATLSAVTGTALLMGRNVSLARVAHFSRGVVRGIVTGITGSLFFGMIYALVLTATLMIFFWLAVDRSNLVGSMLSQITFTSYSQIDGILIWSIGSIFCIIKKEQRGTFVIILFTLCMALLLLAQFTSFSGFAIPVYFWSIRVGGIERFNGSGWYSFYRLAIALFAGIGCGLAWSRIAQMTAGISQWPIRWIVRGMLEGAIVFLIVYLLDSPDNGGLARNGVQLAAIVITSVLVFYAGLGLLSGLGIGLVERLFPRLSLEVIKGLALSLLFTLSFVPESVRGRVAGLACFIGYLCIAYRLPLYLVSGPSTFLLSRASRERPSHVFTYLRRSSLYWDERVFLPLPGLKQMLLIAAQQDRQRTREELMFIVYERPQQGQVAREVLLEMALSELEVCDTITDIAGVARYLDELFPAGEGLLDPRWETPIVQVKKISQDATRYTTPLGWQAKYDALQDMLETQKRVYPPATSGDPRLNRRFADTIGRWRTLLKEELAELEKAPTKTSIVKNPYMPATVLEQHSNVFVGRRDLGLQLEEALSRGSNRPTFLLNGERRMGKSSALLQLPDLLGTRYIPVFYDLQSTSIISSTSALLGAIAEKIRGAMQARGLRTKDLAYETLKEASKENEAATYRVFDTWIRAVERLLEQEDCILLLTLDEFERLDYAEQQGFLNLQLLLGWFRNIIQYHPRIALLFSGVQTLNEMSTIWVSHLVNVQTLKVSFLQPAEARALITQPVPPIFEEGVVEEIMHVTACHPFLVQAVCSVLIDALNVSKNPTIAMPDIESATRQVLSRFGFYFQELWNRTDEAQRACLQALDMQAGDATTVQRQSRLDKPAVRRALETLHQRDMINVQDGMYKIAVPLFSQWLNRAAGL